METDISKMAIPAHVALILDGNGRWAKKRGLPRTAGHKQGCVTVEKTVEDAARLGIKYLTVYGFSTENWKRSVEEVSALMQLFRYYLKRLLKIAKANNVRVKMIGDRTRFDSDIIEGIDRLEQETAANTGMTFVIAVNYGGRDEIRLSNYLLWQLAYSEIYITDCLWPDFNRDELVKAIAQYNTRERRFGGTK